MRRLVALLAASTLLAAAAIPPLAYVSYAGAAYALQHVLVFPAPATPRSELTRQARAADVQELDLVAADGTRLYGWHVDRGSDRLLLFLHGNGGGVTAASWLASQLPGWDVAAISYRGYPGSEGTPSEAGLALDALALWAWATEERGVPPHRIVVQGQSLGGGVAVELLTHVEPAGLVLDSTFHSLVEVAARQAPGLPTTLVAHPFRSDLRAPHVTTPTLLLHGTADDLIPSDHGERLAAELPDAELVLVEGWGHGHWLLDHPAARNAWRTFLEERVPTRS